MLKRYSVLMAVLVTELDGYLSLRPPAAPL